MARGVTYSRTSGEEGDTGQTVGTQTEEVKGAAERLGHVVVASFEDDGVSGDVPPMDRPGFRAAVAFVESGQADFIVFRDGSRFSRAHFCWATIWHAAVRVPMLFLKHDVLTTWGKEPDHTPARALVVSVTFYEPWATLVAIRTTTQTVMTELKEGRRPTKSGKAPHRPVVVIPEDQLEAARRVYGDGSRRGALADAWREVLRIREYDPQGDKRVHSKRYVARNTLARALGVLKDEAAPVALETGATA